MEIPQASFENSQNGMSCHHHSNKIGDKLCPNGMIDKNQQNIARINKQPIPLRIVNS